MQNDKLFRFLFDSAPARGAQVRLHHTWQTILQRRDYPDVLRQPLGELLAASALLGSMLKFDGSLVLQLQGKGALKLLVVEWNADRTLRATAKWEGELPTAASLTELLGQGQFVLILDPKNGTPPYQGIVALEGNSVAEMLQGYMQRSEQLESRLWLVCDTEVACGLLLQRLPEGHGEAEDWHRLCALAGTLHAPELLATDPDILRHRLFHEEQLQVLKVEEQAFGCSCSRERVGGMLQMMGAAEVSDIVQEQGSVEIICDYCHQRYVFDEEDCTQLFRPMPDHNSPTCH